MGFSEIPKPQRSTPPALGGSAAVWLATGLGVGRIRYAPGTFGSLLGLLPAWGLAHLPSAWGQISVLIAVCAVGVPMVDRALPRLGRGKDPGCVVYDEIAGQMLTFLLVPVLGIATLIAGFALFRLFDISKPPPARRLERLPGGLGVMADDWIAGLYANLALRAMMSVAPSWFAF
jgi:phosphatidylglycerophosphatase A